MPPYNVYLMVENGTFEWWPKVGKNGIRWKMQWHV